MSFIFALPDVAGSWNVSSNMVSSNMASSSLSISSVFPMLAGVAVIVGVTLILAFMASSLERYKRFWKWVSKVAGSFVYTVLGGIVAMVAYCTYLVVSTIAAMASGFNPILIVYLVAGYALLTIIGYGTSRILNRLKEYHALTRQNAGSDNLVETTETVLHPEA